MGIKRKTYDSSGGEDDGGLSRRTSTRKRSRKSVNYAEFDAVDDDDDVVDVDIEGGDSDESEYREENGGDEAEGDEYDDDSESGGFILPAKNSQPARGKGRSRTEEVRSVVDSRSSTSTPTLSNRNSKQSTPGTSISDGDEDRDDISILDQPMSSKQATALQREVIVIDEDEDEYEDEDDKPLARRKTKKSSAKAPKRKTTKRRSRARAPRDNRPRYEKHHEKVSEDLSRMHPETVDIFTQLKEMPKIEPQQIDQPEGLSVNLLPFQREGVNWLRKQEEGIYGGGILADEMGMGKTIQTVALMMGDKERVGPNLVVAPTVAMMQWKNEIELYTGGKMQVTLFYGSNRTTNASELHKYDVVLTTYAVCESVYRKQQSGFKRKNGVVKEDSVLHNMMFHRVVLDEAHNIKDRASNTTRAVSTIQSVYKLCLSGTPLQNRIGEIYSLIRFLKIEPFCKYYCRKCDCSLFEWSFSDYRHCDNCGHSAMEHPNFFNHSILKFITRTYSNVSSSDAMANLRTLLSKVMLRRTKLERADDLGLPPRIVHVRRDYFNEEEKDLYASIYSDSNRQFTSYVNEGVVLNNYANIFTLITRMRQVADHPDLVLRRKQDVNNARTALVCKICDDECEDPIRSKCHHTFCRMCIREYVEGWTGSEKDLECPVCHVSINIDLDQAAIEVDQEEVKKGSIINRIDMSTNWRSSTKIEALVEELFKLRSDRRTIKSIVFSQFTSMLDLVEWRLNKAGFQCVKLQGSMSPAQRDGIIRHFMESPEVEVFLVSLKAGGVALNLCEASQVFILDPWWNPSVEWQSGDRVHRIGQHRPVQITRFAIEDSIESRIIELQDKKASMIQATIGNDDASMNRLTPADMQFLFMN